MFVLNTEQQGITRAAEGQILSLLHSINEPKIAALDRPAEPTQAFVCAMDEGSGKRTMHIVLYLSESHQRVVYSWDGQLGEAEIPAAEEEALDFVENMGFMMDNMNLSKFSGPQRTEALGSLPLFQEVTPVAAPLEEAVTSPRVKPVEAPIEPAAGIDLFDGEMPKLGDENALAELEAEFERDSESLESELNSAMEALLPEGEEPTNVPVAEPRREGDTRVSGILRLLSSF